MMSNLTDKMRRQFQDMKIPESPEFREEKRLVEHSNLLIKCVAHSHLYMPHLDKIFIRVLPERVKNLKLLYHWPMTYKKALD